MPGAAPAPAAPTYRDVMAGPPAFNTFVGREVTVLLASGARYEGRLASYDLQSNLVLEAARRVLEDPGAPEGLERLEEGVLVLRGDDVALIGERA